MHYTAFLPVFLFAGVGLAELQDAGVYNYVVGEDATRAELRLPLPSAVASVNQRDFTALKLAVGLKDFECEFDDVWLNDQPLVQHNSRHWQGDFEAVLDNGDIERFDFETSLLCSEHAERGHHTTALVRLSHHHGQDDHSSISGQSAPTVDLVFSFTQSGSHPVIEEVRYEEFNARPVSVSEQIDSEAATSDADTSLPSPTHSSHKSAATSLEDELLALDILQHHAAEIEREIKATQARIMHIWRDDFAKCSTLKCYLKTALTKAPTFAHLVATHFSHHTHLDASFFRKSTHMNCTDEVERVVSLHEQQMTLIDESTDAPEIPVTTVTDVKPDDIELPVDTSATADAQTDSDEQEAAPKWPHGRPPWRQHGPPQHGAPWRTPATENHPPYPPPWLNPGFRPPWASNRENPTPGASPPSDSHWSGRPSFTFSNLNPSYSTRFKVAFIIFAASFISLCALGLALFLCIRRFRDPRRRAERAARREERVTRALYRKAACKYKWTTFWQRCFRVFTWSYWVTVVKADDGEKATTVITVQEASEPSSSTNIITSQINNLRAAHALVRQLMRAEEGRATANPSNPASLRPTRARSEAARSTESLPAYSLPPPSYHSRRRSDADTTSLLASDSGGESENDSEGYGISVVTGFTGYTPSTGPSRDGRSRSQSRSRGARSLLDGVEMETESSVVSCSPRLSMETDRRF